jgi:hypothetical protein
MNNHEDRQTGARQTFETAGLQNSELDEVLKNFRLSVHAWSDAEFARRRTVSRPVHHWSWRLAAGWALGCVLTVASLSTGLFVHHRQEIREQMARLAAARQAQQRQLAVQQAAAQAQPVATAPDDDARLMAAVDKDVSREVPRAMEPLAQLMDEGANQ